MKQKRKYTQTVMSDLRSSWFNSIRDEQGTDCPDNGRRSERGGLTPWW